MNKRMLVALLASVIAIVVGLLVRVFGSTMGEFGGIARFASFVLVAGGGASFFLAVLSSRRPPPAVDEKPDKYLKLKDEVNKMIGQIDYLARMIREDFIRRSLGEVKTHLEEVLKEAFEDDAGDVQE